MEMKRWMIPLANASKTILRIALDIPVFGIFWSVKSAPPSNPRDRGPDVGELSRVGYRGRVGGHGVARIPSREALNGKKLVPFSLP